MFKDRKESGLLLAHKYKNVLLSFQDLVVVALPRGGVPVAYEISSLLNIPLTLFSIQKIPHPRNPDLTIGAASEEGDCYLNKGIISHYGISDSEINKQIEISLKKAKISGNKYRKNRFPLILKNKNILLVDDGVATGATVKLAIKLAGKLKPRSIMLATPVCSISTKKELSRLVDNIYVLETPHQLKTVSQSYENFEEVTDEQVISIINLRNIKGPELNTNYRMY